MCWFGNSYNLKLLDDGRLVRLTYGYSKLGPEDCMCDDKEYVLLNSPELVKEIKKLIKENKEDLKKFQGKYQIIIFWMEPEKRLDLEDIIYK